LEGKVCIISGGGSRTEGMGTGRATACLFAREGGRVAVWDMNADAALYTVDLITKEGGEAAAFVGNVTSAADVERVVGEVVHKWGRIDVLHNNIGIGGADGRGTVVDATEESWDKIMSVNVKSVMLTGKHVIPVMAEGGGGSIINTSSISALRPRGLTPYTTSKGAIIALTTAMAVDHGAQRIRVNCIAPGPLFTPMAMAADDGDNPERRERRRLSSLLKIEGDAWDIAHAAVYFASDESRYVTAQTLVVDGGAGFSGAPR
jgi:NAD(P)-dependent dehydrogenase (short-subunit alcohol dehydrogenase family)